MNTVFKSEPDCPSKAYELSKKIAKDLLFLAERDLRPEKIKKMQGLFEAIEGQMNGLVDQWYSDSNSDKKLDHNYRHQFLINGNLALWDVFCHYTQKIQLSEVFKEGFKNAISLRLQTMMLTLSEHGLDPSKIRTSAPCFNKKFS